MKWFILFLGIISNASASILIKYAVTPPRGFPSLQDPIAALKNWPFWLGIALYGVAFLVYSLALTKLPLNIAHPILTSGAIATVALASVFLFKESFHWSTGTGIAFIVVGVILLSLKVGAS
jgi:multidrug transporter EmrE-like cation transporter